MMPEAALSVVMKAHVYFVRPNFVNLRSVQVSVT